MACIYVLHKRGSLDYRYVGQTISSPRGRLYSHRREAKRGSWGYKNNWMRSVGVDQVEVTVLEVVETKDAAFLNFREQFWIAALAEAGYELVNRTPGGTGYTTLRGPIHSEEQKKKWSEERKGTITGPLNPNYGKFGSDHPAHGRVYSEETRARLSEQKLGAKNPNYGRVVSEEERQKLSERMRGVPQPQNKKNAHTRHHTNKGVSKPGTCAYCAL